MTKTNQPDSKPPTTGTGTGTPGTKSTDISTAVVPQTHLPRRVGYVDAMEGYSLLLSDVDKANQELGVFGLSGISAADKNAMDQLLQATASYGSVLSDNHNHPLLSHLAGESLWKHVLANSDARAIADLDPMQAIEIERNGLSIGVLKELSDTLGLPMKTVYGMLGLPKATAALKRAKGGMLTGANGYAALGLTKILAKVQCMVFDSNTPEAEGFDAGKWLGGWVMRPQPALGGLTPSQMLDTPTGVEVVTRLLGAIESGAYQ